MRRQKPNILITGSVASGKTTLAEELASNIEQLEFVNVTDLILREKCYDGQNDEFDTLMLDEDKLCDALEPKLGAEHGGYVMDYHSSDFFPLRWFDLVVVLRADTDVLFDRLTGRGYSSKKVEENVQCEIFGVSAEQAKESYDAGMVQELPSNTTDQLEDNVEKISAWVQQYMV